MLTVYLVIFLSVVMNCTAQLLFRIAMLRLGHVQFAAGSLLPLAWQMATNPALILGIFLCVGSLMLWLMVLSRAELSLAYPLLSVGYVITAVTAWSVLGESLNPMRLFGIAIIMLGVVLVSRTA